MKPLLISYASPGREDYLKMSESLYRSVKEHWQYDYMFFTQCGNRDEFEGIKLTQINELPQPKTWHCNDHKTTPYQFKFGLINYAYDLGYTHIIWCDASISLAKYPLPLLLNSNRGVMAFHNLGHELSYYIGDDCLRTLNAYPNELNAPQIWGGCIGFDFTRHEACTLFNKVVDASIDGAFNDCGSTREGFKAHRHDQAVMSLLFYRQGVVIYPYGHIVCKEHMNGQFGNHHTFIYGKV